MFHKQSYVMSNIINSINFNFRCSIIFAFFVNMRIDFLFKYCHLHFYFRHFLFFDVANAFVSFLRIAKFATIFLKFSFIDFCSLNRDFRRFECLFFSSFRENSYQLVNFTIRSEYEFSSFEIFMNCFVEFL